MALLWECGICAYHRRAACGFRLSRECLELQSIVLITTSRGQIEVSPLEASSHLLRDAACADEIQRRVHLAHPACSALISRYGPRTLSRGLSYRLN